MPSSFFHPLGEFRSRQATYLLYHTFRSLSSLFLNFFQVFWKFVLLYLAKAFGFRFPSTLWLPPGFGFRSSVLLQDRFALSARLFIFSLRCVLFRLLSVALVRQLYYYTTVFRFCQAEEIPVICSFFVYFASILFLPSRTHISAS